LLHLDLHLESPAPCGTDGVGADQYGVMALLVLQPGYEDLPGHTVHLSPDHRHPVSVTEIWRSLDSAQREGVHR